MKRFISKMEHHYPGLDLTYNENFVFTNEKARELFNVFGLGRLDQHKSEPGCFILARLTEDGLTLAKKPRVMKTVGEANFAKNSMGRKHGAGFFVLTAPISSMEAMERLHEKIAGKEDAMPVSLSNHNNSETINTSHNVENA